jgi:hypothetical protein
VVRPAEVETTEIGDGWFGRDLMTSEHSATKNRKEKVMHELREMVTIFLYLAFFFCALVTYTTLVLKEYHVEYWNYAFALINALVITKVIMIGEYAKEGFCIWPASVRLSRC